MGNRKKENLEEIRQELIDIRERVESLITRLADPDLAVEEDSPIDIDLEDFEAVIPVVGAPEPAEPQKPVPPAEPESDSTAEQESEPEPAAEPEVKSEPIAEPEPAAESEVKSEPIAEPEPAPKVASIKMNRAWKVDIPGSPVSNIISGISLNDRVLFINTLFGEDPVLFQKTIAAFNSMSSLEEAENYIESTFPDWNLGSDVLYRLMMAVRRKLR